MLSHGLVVWAIELVAFDLDTGKEVDRFMLNSTQDLMAASNYTRRLSEMTGFDGVVETMALFREEGPDYHDIPPGI